MFFLSSHLFNELRKIGLDNSFINRDISCILIITNFKRLLFNVISRNITKKKILLQSLIDNRSGKIAIVACDYGLTAIP